MPRIKQTKFRLSPEWIIKQKDKILILSGGADAKYEIELESGGRSFFSSLKHNKSFIRSDLGAHDQRVLEELITAEIVTPELQKHEVIKLAIAADGDELSLPKVADLSIVNNIQACDLVLIIRTNSSYADLLGTIDYSDISKPHLFVDIAFHHTISIGPLVFPGETACVACLQGRVTNRWGDDTPPVVPQSVDRYGGLTAELVVTELVRIKNGDTSLTNKTVSWNLRDRTVKKDQLLKVALCPTCTQNKIDQHGALALPWDKNESITNTI